MALESATMGVRIGLRVKTCEKRHQQTAQTLRFRHQIALRGLTVNRISSLQSAWCGAYMCARLHEVPQAPQREGNAPVQDARCSKRMLLPEPGGPSNKTGRVCGDAC